MIRQSIILTLIILLSGCRFDSVERFTKDETFTEVQDLDSLKKTRFVTTLESQFDTTMNAIYSPTMIYAWDEIKIALSEPIKTIASDGLVEIDNSQLYKGVLSLGEFMTNVEIQENKIIAKAYFKKSLPFKTPLERDLKPLSFLGDSVISFGFLGYSEHAKIVYYNNDNDFAIKLLPSDNTHEIILIKTNFDTQSSLKSSIDMFFKKIALYKQKRNDNNYWKYWINDDDRVRIPIIDFNIETNYKNIEGTSFETESRKMYIEKAYQMTAFRLDEKGAEIESESQMEAVEEIMEGLPKPKKLIFDSPYMILLRKKTSKYPYFVMYVKNSELMIKE